LNRLLIFKNRYLIAGIIFIVWAVFFAQYDILSLVKQKKELAEMQQKMVYLEKEIDDLQKEQIALKTDPKAVEKYSREHYFMKKSNEDVYIIDSTYIDTIKN
jgi:cell division protein FtsB